MCTAKIPALSGFMRLHTADALWPGTVCGCRVYRTAGTGVWVPVSSIGLRRYCSGAVQAQSGILSMRRWWRPPSKSVLRKVSTIFTAVSLSIKRAGSEQMFASLCLRASSAISGSQQMAARMPWCLFSVIVMPFALPHSAMPRGSSPFSIALANGGHSPDSRRFRDCSCRNHKRRTLSSRGSRPGTP